MSRRSWSQLTQTVCTVALILLLGIASYALVHSAGSAYATLTEQQQHDYNLRVAANYLTNKVRQYDTAGGIKVEASPFGDCLVLSEVIEGTEYQTRIYLLDGMLRESFVMATAPYDNDTAFDIVELEGFAVRGGTTLYFTLTENDETRTVAITPRSEAQNEG